MVARRLSSSAYSSRTLRLPIAAAALMALAAGHAMAAKAARPTTSFPPVPVPWNAAAQGQFVMSLAADHQGRLWVGTEDDGVWRYDPAVDEKDAWTHFTTHDGLGDNDAYALCVDSMDRVGRPPQSRRVRI